MEPKRRGRPRKNPTVFVESLPENPSRSNSAGTVNKTPELKTAKEPPRRGHPPKAKFSSPDEPTLISEQSSSTEVLHSTKKPKISETSGDPVTDQPHDVLAKEQNSADSFCPSKEEKIIPELSQSSISEAQSVIAVPPESTASPENLQEEYRDLLARISLKENKLRNLRLLQSYRERNDFSSGEAKIKTWKKALRDALIAIDSEHPDPKPPLSYFVSTLCIDPKIIGFDATDGCFL